VTDASTPAIIVLAGHGAPATDYPAERLGQLMMLHTRLERTSDPADHARLAAQAEVAEREVRSWPRTPENDPYKAGLEALAARLAAHTGFPVEVGYNEFCAPSVSEAIDRAVERGARKIVVLTTMLTPGGQHSEADFRQIVAEAQTRHPGVAIVYAWPFDLDRVAALFAEQAAPLL